MSAEPGAIVAAAADTDEELVRRIVEGDKPLFEIVMRRHNQRIYRAVRAVLGADEDVEDVMQQAYLNAYRHLGKFAGEARFSTWLTRIAVNEAIARRRKNARPFGWEEDLMHLAAPDPDPERRAAAAELGAAVEREIAELPDAFRVVLVMRDVEELSTAETAACLEISEDLVKTRLHRARALLRENLYRRAGLTLQSVLTFGNNRCDRVVSAVLSSIG